MLDNSMNKILLIGLPLFLIGCDKLPLQISTSSRSTDKIKILVTGQSNGNSPANNFGTIFTQTNRVHTKHVSYGETEFTVHGVDNPTTSDISWIILGDKLATNASADVYISNVSYGNTNSQIWETRYLPNLVDEIENFKPDMILWIQGESDAADHLTADASRHAYSAIFQAINKHRPAYCRVYMALDGFYTNDGGGSLEQAPARLAQKFVLQMGWASKGPDIDQMRLERRDWFELVSHNAMPGAEFDNQGLIAHADAWYDVLRWN